MEIEFSGAIWFWRGPSPFHFVTVPPEECADIKAVSGLVTYGWGMIPVTARIGNTEWKTSMFPKENTYILPIKASVRTTENLAIGDLVTIRLIVG